MASPVPADNTNQLQITDLAEVLRLLRRHGYSGTSYYELGLFLGLSSATLDAIRENERNVESCLRECLNRWLQKADDVQKKGGPTIYSLVSALRELEQKAVAHGIDMEKHPACRILARYTSNQSLVTALPQLTTLLYSEVMKEKAISINVQGEALLIQIKEAVCIDYQKLEAFAKILCEITPTAEIGNAIMIEYREVYCSDDLIKPNDSNGETFCRKDFLIGNGENAEELKIYLPQSMIKEFKTMRLKFGETFSSVKDIMKANPPAIEKIRDTLNFSYRPLKPQLAQCQDINSILELINEKCSLNDISMLEFFVTQSKIDELAKTIQEYNEAFKIFSETKLTEYLEGELSYASPLQCERIIIVVDRNTDECTLDDVRRLSADTFHDLSQHIILNVIRDDNSFTITCSFPLILSEQLIAAALNNIDALKENKVKRLTIGYCTVYEIKDNSTPTKCGLMKQLMLSLSVQLINSTEELTTLNEESMRLKEEEASLKGKLKMLKARTIENEMTLMENKNLKEINKIQQEKLALFQSEKEVEEIEIKEIKQFDSKVQSKEKAASSAVNLLNESIQLLETKEKEIEKFSEEILLLKQQLAAYQEDAEKLAGSEKLLKEKLLTAEKDIETLQLENGQLQSEKEKIIALGKSKIKELQETVKVSKRTVAYGGPHLTIADLAHVDDLLTRHGFIVSNGFKLGLELGLSPNTLDVIETRLKEDASRCLWECLKQWLKLADDVKSKGGTTIPALIKALRKIGETATANGICNETHPACRILKMYISDQSLVKGLPQLALFLYKEGIIGTMIMMAPEDARGLDLEALLALIQDSVCADYQNLEKFAAILQQFPPTTAIGTLIRNDYIEMVFDDITEVHNKIKFLPMRHTYAQVVTNACSAMNAIPSDDLKKFLCGGYPYLITQLEHINTTDDILDVVCSRRCSIVNVSLLENVARHYKVEEAIAILEEYKKSLKELKPLRKLLDEKLLSGSSLECGTITFTVHKNVDNCTLDDVELLLRLAFKELAHHVMIKVIREHKSFIVLCSFPLSLSEELIATAQKNIEVLKDKGVKKLTIGSCTVYNNETVSNFDTGAQDEECQSLPSIFDKLEQLMFSQNLHLINREQELIHQSEIDKQEIQELKAQVEQLRNDEAHSRLKQENDTLLKENEKLHQEVSTLRQESYMYSIQRKQELKQDPNPIAFQDDIYGDIVIDDPLIIKIVETKQFQRLRDIKKLGYTYLNIPKTSFSRLQHSIGMYYLAGEYVKQLQRRQPELNITESDVLCVQIAALCYNLGHGPFSHTFSLFLDEVFPNGDKPWEKVSEASVMMFDHMIEENDEVKYLFEELLDDYKEDIEFIKELIHVQGTRKGQRKGKEFLYEIVVNKTSGFDVCMIDYTTRDAAALGMNINFKWRVFLSKVAVMKCANGERHIFFQEDDLDTYYDLFRTRQSLFTELYYFRKNRILTAMITRILVKSNDAPIIRDGDRLVTISEATKSMSAYTQLDDGILNTIKILVNDPEVQVLLKCLDTFKFIGQIGYVRPKDDWDTNKIKQHIVQSTKSCDITDQLIMDPIIHGYENHESLTQYYYTSDGRTGQWTHEWAQQPPPFAAKPSIRVFLVSGDKQLIHEVYKKYYGT